MTIKSLLFKKIRLSRRTKVVQNNPSKAPKNLSMKKTTRKFPIKKKVLQFKMNNKDFGTQFLAILAANQKKKNQQLKFKLKKTK